LKYDRQIAATIHLSKMNLYSPPYELKESVYFGDIPAVSFPKVIY